MKRFNSSKWITENKYGPVPKLTTQPEEDEWEDKVSEIEKIQTLKQQHLKEEKVKKKNQK